MSIARSHRTLSRRIRRLSAASLGGAALVLALAAGPVRADAPMFRGNSGLTGAYAERVNPPLALHWKYTSTYSGYNPSSPAVVGNVVYFASGSRFYAVDADTGALKWRYPQDEPMSTTILTSPAFAGGQVLFGAGDGSLYALHADTGKTAWAFSTRSSIGASPTVDNGIAYFGSSDGRLWAVDCTTGAAVPGWTRGVQLTDEVTGAPAVANGMVYALTADQKLHAIGAATGKERYITPVGGSVLKMTPVAVGDYVYVGAGANMYCFLARNLTIQKWMVPLPTDIAASPAIGDQGVYVVCTDNRVRALDPRSGKLRWSEAKLPKLQYDVVAPPALSGDTLYVGTVEGGVYAIDAGTGAIRWTYSIEPSTRDTSLSNTGRGTTTTAASGETGVPAVTNVAAAPVISNHSLYVLSDDGTVSCFRADASDTLPPTVTEMQPDAGVVINGSPPIHFEAKIMDDGSGIDPATVKILIDEQGVARRPDGPDNENKPGFKYDSITDTLEYDTPVPAGAGTERPLPDGRHTVTVVATDWKGNTVSKSWTFTVDNTVVRTGRKRQATNVGPGGRPGGPGGMPGSGGSGGMPGSGGNRGGMPGGFPGGRGRGR